MALDTGTEGVIINLIIGTVTVVIVLVLFDLLRSKLPTVFEYRKYLQYVPSGVIVGAETTVAQRGHSHAEGSDAMRLRTMWLRRHGACMDQAVTRTWSISDEDVWSRHFSSQGMPILTLCLGAIDSVVSRLPPLPV